MCLDEMVTLEDHTEEMVVNRPSHSISFMTDIPSTSGRRVQTLHCEFVCLLFLQTHREADHVLTTSGVHLVHFRHTVFSSHLKSKVGHILANAATLRIVLIIDSF